ncbi:MAG: DNA-binding protein [Thiotrichaceae bacterium IS1]|nr:MAG: DNA-binding protein [Thiotrichaceae bacterium IS1]
MKPKVYIETSIPSYLTARPSNDIRAMANQNVTLEWWETRRVSFDLFISEFVLAEVSLGNPEAAQKRLAAIAGLPELTVTEEAKSLANVLMTEGAIPKNSEMDAYHISVAAANGMDYLLTWNCAHIANATLRPKIEAICRKHGFEPPIICTPQELIGELERPYRRRNSSAT